MSLLRTIRPLALLGLAAVPMIACSQSAEDVPEDDSSAIIGGTTSGPEDDAVVAILQANPHKAATAVLRRHRARHHDHQDQPES